MYSILFIFVLNPVIYFHIADNFGHHAKQFLSQKAETHDLLLAQSVQFTESRSFLHGVVDSVLFNEYLYVRSLPYHFRQDIAMLFHLMRIRLHDSDMRIRNLNIVLPQNTIHPQVNIGDHGFGRSSGQIVDDGLQPETAGVKGREIDLAIVHTVLGLFSGNGVFTVHDFLPDQTPGKLHIARIGDIKREHGGSAVDVIAVIVEHHVRQSSVGNDHADRVHAGKHRVPHSDILDHARCAVLQLNPVTDFKGLVHTDHQACQYILDDVLSHKDDHRTDEGSTAEQALPNIGRAAESGERENNTEDHNNG